MSWFQLYAPRDRDLMRDLLRRARVVVILNTGYYR